MIKTSSKIARKYSEIFGNLRKSLDIFGNCRKMIRNVRMDLGLSIFFGQNGHDLGKSTWEKKKHEKKKN